MFITNNVVPIMSFFNLILILKKYPIVITFQYILMERITHKRISLLWKPSFFSLNALHIN